MTAFHVRLRPTPVGESYEHYVARVQAEIDALAPGIRAEPAAERASNNQIVDIAHSVAWSRRGDHGHAGGNALDDGLGEAVLGLGYLEPRVGRLGHDRDRVNRLLAPFVPEEEGEGQKVANRGGVGYRDEDLAPGNGPSCRLPVLAGGGEALARALRGERRRRSSSR